MCEKHQPWLEVSEIISTAECCHFGDLDGLCKNPFGPNSLKPCPTRGRAPWEVAARKKRGEWS